MTESDGIVIKTAGLWKTFNHGQLTAVDGLDLEIKRGDIFSLLGPNGAGKSTTIRMLTTVMRPDAGDIKIGGLDTVRDREAVQNEIGVCPQEIVIFDELTAQENVEFIARMHGFPKKEAARKAHALLEHMELAERTDKAKNFSGGMKRRLNVIMALVHEPVIAFLDEPTAGLDPQARRLVWDFIRGLKETGMTVVLTTHDMVEAEAVSDYVAIIDHGQIIAQGSVDYLKEKFGSGTTLEMGFSKEKDLEQVLPHLEAIAGVSKVTRFEDHQLLVMFEGSRNDLLKIVQQRIFKLPVEIDAMNFRTNTLEDVFLHLTGRRLREE